MFCCVQWHYCISLLIFLISSAMHTSIYLSIRLFISVPIHLHSNHLSINHLIHHPLYMHIHSSFMNQSVIHL